MSQLIEIKEENGLIIQVYAPAEPKPLPTVKAKTGTKLTRREIKAIQGLSHG